MKKSRKIRVPVILGPTAVGKTKLCLDLANDLASEIISCDSRQIYKYMDIGTAKPSGDEQAKIKHWLIDIIEPSQIYSAFQFTQDTLRIIRERAKKNQGLLLSGGTGLYFKSLSEGLSPTIQSDLKIRKELKQKIALEGPEKIYQELQQCDPVSASRLHPHDSQRIIRALQVYKQTGIPFSCYQNKKNPPEDIDFYTIILELPRPILYKRINDRVDIMFEQGLWNEFCYLRKKGYSKSDPGMQGVGYKELFKVENRTYDLLKGIEKIKQNSRNYAKRQITWFTNKTNGLRISAASLSEKSNYRALKSRILNFLNQ